jgi:nucleoside-diphosphate-sugar epimerase
MNHQRILVTGGTGFLGAALVRRLIANQHTVRVLDNGFRSSIKRLADIQDNVEFIEADIRDDRAVAQAICGMDVVIHLAAVNGTEFFYSKPTLVLEVGIRGILNVLNGCLQEGVSKLFVASSSEVYQTPLNIPTSETEFLKVPDPLNPRYSYGGSKIITELLALNYGFSQFERVVVFRPHNVYGPAMGHEHVLPQFILRAIEQISKHPSGPIPFDIQGNGTQTRAFIHINDMVDGILLLLEKGIHLNIYHVGTETEITMADLAKKVVNYFQREIQLKFNPLLLGSTERRCPNINKIKALGFNPKISLDAGLPSIIEWYTEGDPKVGR